MPLLNTSGIGLQEIITKSTLRSLIIDVPIALAVTSSNEAPSPLVVGSVTFVGAFSSYFIRALTREYKIPYINRELPYIGSIIGGASYYALIEGLKLKDLSLGALHQLLYDINIDYNPYFKSFVGNLITSVAIETVQNQLEGQSYKNSMLIGLYVGLSLEYLYKPILKKGFNMEDKALTPQGIGI